MARKHVPILKLGSFTKEGYARVGEKAVGIGVLIDHGFNVPPGFVITGEAYQEVVSALLKEDERTKTGSTSNTGDVNRAEPLFRNLRRAIERAKLPESIGTAIANAYHELNEPVVAVRASSVAANPEDAAFAGQLASFLGITTLGDVLKSVQSCWGSAFGSRAVFYRTHEDFSHSDVVVAVIVQRMVQASVSGVLLTAEPIFNDSSRIVVEVVWGLGSVMDAAGVTPDLYVLDKETLAVLERRATPQDWKLVYNPNAIGEMGPATRVPVLGDEREAPKLTEDDLRTLGTLGKQIEATLGGPQEIEWAKEGDTFYILQSRPGRGISFDDDPQHHQHERTGKVLLSGVSVNPGVTMGLVRVVRDAAQMAEVEEGDILVLETPDAGYEPAMMRAAAVVADKPDTERYAASICGGLGIPCIAATGTATRVLKSRQRVTVDGTWGRVLEGAVPVKTGRGHRQRGGGPMPSHDLSIPLLPTIS